MKKFLVFVLALLMSFCTMSFAVATSTTQGRKMTAKVETRRIPKGTRLKVKMLDYIGTETSAEGAMFSATLVEDKKIDNSMILPSGTIVRGYIARIKPAKMLSRGAVMYLLFDHIVIPTGTQLKIKSIMSGNMKMTLDGGLYSQLGYGDALKDNWKKTKEITSTATHWGMDKDTPWNYVLTPFTAVGGAIGGGAYYVGDSVIDIFRKGQPVSINKNDIIEIVIMQDLDVPVL